MARLRVTDDGRLRVRFSDGVTLFLDYDPDQPRDPQGRWTEGGGGTYAEKHYVGRKTGGSSTPPLPKGFKGYGFVKQGPSWTSKEKPLEFDPPPVPVGPPPVSQNNYSEPDFNFSPNVGKEEREKFVALMNSLPPKFADIVATSGTAPAIYRNGHEDYSDASPGTKYRANAYYSYARDQITFYLDRNPEDYTRVLAHEIGHQWDLKHGNPSGDLDFKTAFVTAQKLWKEQHKIAADAGGDVMLLRDDYYMSKIKEAWAAASEILMYPKSLSDGASYYRVLKGEAHNVEFGDVLKQSGILDIASRFYVKMGVLPAGSETNYATEENRKAIEEAVRAQEYYRSLSQMEQSQVNYDGAA